MSFKNIILLLLVSVVVGAALPINNQNNDKPDSSFSNMMKKLMMSMSLRTGEKEHVNVGEVAGVAGAGIMAEHESVRNSTSECTITLKGYQWYVFMNVIKV